MIDPELFSLHAPRSIGDDGRCCGRKPLAYRREGSFFCTRCDRTFDILTKTQKANFHWFARGGGFRLSDTAIICEHIRQARERGENGVFARDDAQWAVQHAYKTGDLT